MRYSSTFKDINEKRYWLEITTNGDSGTTQEVLLGTPAFTMTFESGDSTIYKPIKYSSATCTIATTDILSDIYTGKNQGTSIKLTDDERTLFTGYITPNVYNQPYNGTIDYLELECIDALSTLKNIDYTTVGKSKSIVSFKNIICHILQQCNAYKYMYVSNVISATSNNIDVAIEELYISENNFFDEDDEAMKCSEVLEEIMKFLNMSMYADGMHIYIVDFDAIVSDTYTYYDAYDIASFENCNNPMRLPDTKVITSDDFKGCEGNLSIDNVYNKATVESDLYVVDEIVNDVYDDEFLTNNLGEWGNIKREIFFDNDQKGDAYYLYYRLMQNDQLVHTYYYINQLSDNNNDTYNVGICAIPPNIVYWDFPIYSMKNYVGCTFADYYISEYPHNYYSPINHSGEAYPEDQISFSRSLIMHLNNTMTQDQWNMGVRRKLLTIKPFDKNIITNAIEINMKTKWTDNVDYLKNPDKEETTNKKCEDYPKIPYLVTCDNKVLHRTFSYNLLTGYSETSEWVEVTDTTNLDDYMQYFEFWLENDTFWDNATNWKKNYINRDLQLFSRRGIYDENTINTDTNKGVVFKVPIGMDISKLRIHLYQPNNPNYDYDLQAVFIDDLSVKIYHPENDINTKSSDKAETNTKYENVINDDWVEELETITFKICTFDNKQPNYSAVYTKDSAGNYTYVDALYNKALGQTLRQEEMLIYRIVNQYQNPRIKLDFQLRNNYTMKDRITYHFENGKTFIVDAMTIDFENDTAEITLIEKA